jgi:hypothetical protein
MLVQQGARLALEFRMPEKRVFMSKSPRFIVMALLTFCNVCLLYPQSKPQPPVVEDFDLQGTALFQCQCPAHACPCQKNGAPNHGTCEASDFVHIRTGRYGKLYLDGLNAVVVGNLVDKNAARLYAAIYIDQKADSAQQDALTAILQFMNGAYETSALQASQIKFVPVVFSESPDKTTYTVNVPGILDERTILHRGASGEPLSNVTAMDAWSNTEHYADNELYKYHDSEVRREWDHSGAYANLKFFHLTKKMYDQKEMLGQFGDFSGHWTSEQLAIIHKQGLKE